jgi:hypothetical protein
MVRDWASRVVEAVVVVVVGAWLLFLFALALAWTPMDRRLGLDARRRASRLRLTGSEPASARGAYSIAAAP